MKAPLPLLSAIMLLVSAGMVGPRSLAGAGFGVIFVAAALWLLRDRDRQLSTRIIEDALQARRAIMREAYREDRR